MIHAVVLAAGAGRKFQPFSEVRNKTAFPLGEEIPVRRLVRRLRSAGLAEVVVVVGAGAASVRHALAGEAGVRWVTQGPEPGTAAAVLDAVRELGLPSGSSLVVLSGDVVAGDATIQEVVACARRGETASVVCPLRGEPPGDWIACAPAGDTLTGIEGHGRDGTHRLPGLYALGSEAVAALAANPGVMTHVPVGGMPPRESEIAETLAALADRGRPARALECPDFAVDLDGPWHILEAARELLSEWTAGEWTTSLAEGARISDTADIAGRVRLGPGATIGANVKIRGDVWLGAGAQVTNGSILEGSCWIGPRSIVRDYALIGEGSILGADVICGHGAEFQGVMLDGSYLYHYCEISGVLGASVDIGAATVCGTLRFDDSATRHNVQGWRTTPRIGANASYLGDYCRTGVNAVLMPGVKVGAYSCVGPGVVLYEDLPSRRIVTVKQELSVKPWGPERYGW